MRKEAEKDLGRAVHERPPGGAARQECVMLPMRKDGSDIRGNGNDYLLASRSAIGPMIGSLKYLPFSAATAQSTKAMITAIQ